MPLDANALGQFVVPGRGSAAFTGGSFDPNDPGILRKFLFGLTQLPHDIFGGQQSLADVTPGQTLDYAAQFAVPGAIAAPKGGLGMAGGRLSAEGLGAAQAQPWFSALQKGVEAAPLKSAPGEQWLGTLKNMPGVKPEELSWTGFQDWLRSKPSVTKQEATNYLNQNQVQLGEVMKQDTFSVPEGSLTNRPMREHGEDTPKFSQYQLPGGENYREMLLTLPPKPMPRVGTTADESLTSYLDRSFEAQPPVFKSGHYDEPNVLAHTRFNDRTTADGKKTLFLEEIQSDWHQKGRKAGYESENKARRDAVSAAERKWIVAQQLGKPADEITAAKAEYDAASNAADEHLVKHGSAVPDAPFKTTWPDLALKRMIKYAVDNGYDSVSWTPGKVQAERYDLSKHVAGLDYSKRGVLTAYKPGKGHQVLFQREVPEAELADHVGKEVAQKLVDTEADASGIRSLRGMELRVGGEGMKGFYDKILPAAANKLGKKYGAKVGVATVDSGLPIAPGQANAEMAKLRGDTTQEVWTLPITDAMRKEVGAKGMPLFTGGSPLGAAAMGAQQKLSPDQSRKYLTGGFL